MEVADTVEAVRRRAALLRDDSITARLDSLAYGLTVAIFDAEERGDQRVNLWPVRFPISDLRAALDAFLLREDPPAPLFPAVEEAREIVVVDRIGLPNLHREIRGRVRKARAG